MKDITFEHTISHQCGVTMNDSVEARAIAEVMAEKPEIKVTYMPAMIRIDGNGKMEFKMDEISEELGRDMTPHLFEISTSTHYGRMVMIDDNTVMLFGNMDDVMEYIVKRDDAWPGPAGQADPAAPRRASTSTPIEREAGGKHVQDGRRAKKSSSSTGTPISGTAARRTSGTSTASSSSSASMATTRR